MCFVHKHMQNADFGQILSRRASTKSRVTSRPMVRFSQTWYQKMRKTWKKKVIKRRVAISGGRDAVADFVQGGVKLTPPPVKIGLKQNCRAFSRAASWLFSLKSYGYFDPKFVKIEPPVTESHDLLWPEVNPKRFDSFCVQNKWQCEFLFWPVNQ